MRHPIKFGSHDISWTISCLRAHNVPAPNKTCKKLLIEEIAKSWSWYCLTLLYNMMGNKPYRNVIMNAPLKWRVPVRSPPSTKASATATQGHHRGSHSGDQELVQERAIALILLHPGGQALVFFSQWHDGCQAQNCQEHREGGSPGAAGSGGHVHKVLEAPQHLALGGLVKVDG